MKHNKIKSVKSDKIKLVKPNKLDLKKCIAYAGGEFCGCTANMTASCGC